MHAWQGKKTAETRKPRKQRKAPVDLQFVEQITAHLQQSLDALIELRDAMRADEWSGSLEVDGGDMGRQAALLAAKFRNAVKTDYEISKIGPRKHVARSKQEGSK
jgi:hypothetical protein